MAHGDEEHEAAQSLENFRADLSLMRRALERLATEHAEPPEARDYSETLSVISQMLSATAQRVDVLVRSPALSLTPDEVSLQITAAGHKMRGEDHRALMTAAQRMEDTAASLHSYLRTEIAAGVQHRRLAYAGMIGLVLGMVLLAVFAGRTARAMPARWLWPERVAAGVLAMPMWEGGQRLMVAASPRAFSSIAAGNRLRITNRDGLEACRNQSIRLKKAVRCVIQVKEKD